MSARRPTLKRPLSGVVALSRISQGKPVEILIDAADYPVVSKCETITVLVTLACSTVVYGTTGKTLARFLLHAQPEKVVRYKNGNRLDLRRENISLVDRTRSGRGAQTCGSGLFWVRRTICGELRVVACATKINSKGRKYRKQFSFEKYGIHEAMRRALSWRVSRYQELGKTLPGNLLEALDRATRMARAGGAFEDIYGGNAEYENAKVVSREVAHWANQFEEAA